MGGEARLPFEIAPEVYVGNLIEHAHGKNGPIVCLWGKRQIGTRAVSPGHHSGLRPKVRLGIWLDYSTQLWKTRTWKEWSHRLSLGKTSNRNEGSIARSPFGIATEG